MKKLFAAAALLLALLLCLTFVLADGGDADDPLLSLSFLEGVFAGTADTAVDNAIARSDETALSALEQQLDGLKASAQALAGQNLAVTPQETTLKEGDALTGATGLAFLPLTGQLSLEIISGSVVDVTAGSETPSGTVLTTGHRYLVAESSVARVYVLSPTAVISYEGRYALSLSDMTPDYYGIATALRQLDLFRGTGSGIGEGFDLHLTPTRAEGLVMFIRILGEEGDALACAATHPFTDVPAWADCYVAWAYERGYTNGVSATKFGTGQAISAVEYTEFLLRALGYSVAGIHDYTTSIPRAVECGALTEGEYLRFSEEAFLRAQVAYLSYYSLDAVLSGSQSTLADRLESAGAFSGAQRGAARRMVTSQRIF